MGIDKAKGILFANNRIVVFSGIGLCTESDIPYFLSEEESFRAENEFGYSPEDLFSSVFFNTRPDVFFQYYKNYILHLGHTPTAAHSAVTTLEQQGKLTGIVTRSIYSLHQVAGAQNVLELHGSIYKNVCTKCGAEYCASYIKSSKGIPTCKNCNSIIRPKIGLFGERIDNGILTAACKAVASADVLLVIGADLHSNLTERFISHFHGNDIVVINEEDHYTDRQASVVIHDKVSNVLPLII